MSTAPQGGTPSAALFAYSLVGHEALGALLDLGWRIPFVATHPDDPGEALWFPSVAERAAGAGLRVIRPESKDDPAPLAALRESKPDFLLSFYYRWMLPAEAIEIPARGAFNLHGSLLPKYRGKASIHWQILRGEKTAGVTLHRMVAKPDAGAILAQRAVEIGPDDEALEVTRRVAAAAAALLRDSLPALARGELAETPMNLAEGFYLGGRKPEDGRIDWNRPAREIHDLVRAVARPFPGAFCLTAGRKLFVWKSRVADESSPGAPGRVLRRDPLVIGCGRGALEIVSGQFDGERERPGPELPLGERL